MEQKEPFRIAVNGGQHEFAVLPEEAKNLDIVPDGKGAFHDVPPQVALTGPFGRQVRIIDAVRLAASCLKGLQALSSRLKAGGPGSRRRRPGC